MAKKLILGGLALLMWWWVHTPAVRRGRQDARSSSDVDDDVASAEIDELARLRRALIGLPVISIVVAVFFMWAVGILAAPGPSFSPWEPFGWAKGWEPAASFDGPVWALTLSAVVVAVVLASVVAGLSAVPQGPGLAARSTVLDDVAFAVSLAGSIACWSLAFVTPWESGFAGHLTVESGLAVMLSVLGALCGPTGHSARVSLVRARFRLEQVRELQGRVGEAGTARSLLAELPWAGLVITCGVVVAVDLPGMATHPVNRGSVLELTRLLIVAVCWVTYLWWTGIHRHMPSQLPRALAYGCHVLVGLLFLLMAVATTIPTTWWSLASAIGALVGPALWRRSSGRGGVVDRSSKVRLARERRRLEQLIQAMAARQALAIGGHAAL